MSDYQANGGYGHRPATTPGAAPASAMQPAPAPQPETIVSVVRADQPQPAITSGGNR